MDAMTLRLLYDLFEHFDDDPVVYDLENDLRDWMASKIQDDGAEDFEETNPELNDAMIQVWRECCRARCRRVPLSRSYFDAWETDPFVRAALLNAGEVFGWRHRNWIRYTVLSGAGGFVVLKRSFLYDEAEVGVSSADSEGGKGVGSFA